MSLLYLCILSVSSPDVNQFCPPIPSLLNWIQLVFSAFFRNCTKIDFMHELPLFHRFWFNFFREIAVSSIRRFKNDSNGVKMCLSAADFCSGETENISVFLKKFAIISLNRKPVPCFCGSTRKNAGQSRK